MKMMHPTRICGLPLGRWANWEHLIDLLSISELFVVVADQLTTLRSLSVPGCGLCGCDILHFRQLTQLTHLDLSDSQLDTLCDEILQMLIRLDQLQVLLLGNNYSIDDEGFARLASAIQEMSSLRELDVSGSSITSQSRHALVTACQHLGNLRI